MSLPPNPRPQVPHAEPQCTLKPPRRPALPRPPPPSPVLPLQMGLGKSLQTIMLIVSNPPPPDWTHTPVSVRERLQHHYFRAAPGPLSALMDDPHGDPAAIKTTLLVTPANLQVRADRPAAHTKTRTHTHTYTHTCTNAHSKDVDTLI